MSNNFIVPSSNAVVPISDKTFYDLAQYVVRRFLSVPSGPLLFMDFGVEPKSNILHHVLGTLRKQLFRQQNIEIVIVQVSLVADPEKIPQHFLKALYMALEKSPFWGNMPLDLKAELQKAYREGIGTLKIESTQLQRETEESRKIQKRQQAELKEISLDFNLFGLSGGVRGQPPGRSTNVEDTKVRFTEKVINQTEKYPAPDNADNINKLNHLLRRLSSNVRIMFYENLVQALENSIAYDPNINRIKILANQINNSCLVDLLVWIFFPIYLLLVISKWLLTPVLQGIKLIIIFMEYVTKLVARKTALVKELCFLIIVDGLEGDEIAQNEQTLSMIRSIISNPSAMFMVFADEKVCSKL